MISKALRAPGVLFDLAYRLYKHEGGRDATSYLMRLGCSYVQALRLTRNFKKLLRPVKAWQRAAYRPAPAAISIDPRKGWLKCPPIEGAPELAAYCAELFNAKQNAVLAEFTPPYGFVIKYRDQGRAVFMDEPDEIRPILRFCEKMIDTVAEYMGEAPVLSNVSLVYTQEHSTKIGPQLFHRDTSATRQVHLVMPVWTVDDEAGPFTFLPADKSETVIRALNHTRARIEDDLMFQHCSPYDLVKCEGEPGEVYLLDPCRCIHFGARTKTRPRLLLIANFTSLFEGAEGQHAVYRASNRHALDDGSMQSRLLLDL